MLRVTIHVENCVTSDRTIRMLVLEALILMGFHLAAEEIGCHFNPHQPVTAGLSDQASTGGMARGVTTGDTYSKQSAPKNLEK